MISNINFDEDWGYSTLQDFEGDFDLERIIDESEVYTDEEVKQMSSELEVLGYTLEVVHHPTGYFCLILKDGQGSFFYDKDITQFFNKLREHFVFLKYRRELDIFAKFLPKKYIEECALTHFYVSVRDMFIMFRYEEFTSIHSAICALFRAMPRQDAAELVINFMNGPFTLEVWQEAEETIYRKMKAISEE